MHCVRVPAGGPGAGSSVAVPPPTLQTFQGQGFNVGVIRHELNIAANLHTLLCLSRGGAVGLGLLRARLARVG